MGNTTKELVWVIAPEFKCTSPALIELILLDAQGMVGTNYGAKQEIAQRYLVAHLLTIFAPAAQDVGTGILKERLGDEDVTYLKPDKWDEFNSTKYGIMYNKIAKRAITTVRFITP